MLAQDNQAVPCRWGIRGGVKIDIFLGGISFRQATDGPVAPSTTPPATTTRAAKTDLLLDLKRVVQWVVTPLSALTPSRLRVGGGSQFVVVARGSLRHPVLGWCWVLGGEPVVLVEVGLHVLQVTLSFGQLVSL